MQTRPIPELTAIELTRFADRYIAEPMSGCWIWLGATSNASDNDYGSFGIRREGKTRTYRAHRVSFRNANGPIPGDLDLHHKCELKCCVNPQHLQPVTEWLHSVLLTPNGPSYINARREACKNGHPFTEENTRIRKDGNRACKECARVAAIEIQKRTPGYGKKKGPPLGWRPDPKPLSPTCGNGHLLEGDNVYWYTDKKGRRVRKCYVCGRASALAYWRAKNPDATKRVP